MSEADYLKDYLKKERGQIVTVNGKWATELWQQNRNDYLYDGDTLKKLREVCKDELVIEFDHKNKPGVGTPEFNAAKEEAIKINQLIAEEFDKKHYKYHITDHDGRSPHLRTRIVGLDAYPAEVRAKYKKELVDEIFRHIGFKLELVEVDDTLLMAYPKLVSSELQPHFKPEWAGKIERIVKIGVGEFIEVDKQHAEDILDSLWVEVKPDVDTPEVMKQFIEKVKSKIKVSDILKEFKINVNKNPTDCPFHASAGGKCLSFNDGKGLWKCFHSGCDKGGDIFHLWQFLHNNCSFADALRDFAIRLHLLQEFETLQKNIRKTKNQEKIALAIECYAGVEYINDEGKTKRTKPNIKMGNQLVTEYLFESMDLLHDPLNDLLKVYSENKFYEDIGEYVIKEQLEELLGIYSTRSVRAEIIEKLKNMAKKSIDMKKLPLNLIPFKNGMLDINTMQMRVHSPYDYCEIQIPTNYNPEAKCPEIDKFISEVVEPGKASLIYDCMGLVFYREQILEKIFILLGSGQNGKTILIQVLEHTVGEKNRSSVPLSQLTNDRFAIASTWKKLLNCGADIGGKTIYDASMLRSLSSRDTVSAQFKFGQIFDFTPSATLVFSANSPPIFTEDVLGNFRRLESMGFPNNYGNKADLIAHTDWKVADPKILDKLTTQAELEGFVAVSVAHLRHIMETSALSIVRSTDELRTTYVRSSDTLKAFMDENCTEAAYEGAKGREDDSVPAQGFIYKGEFYSKYKKWCEDNRLNCFSPIRVGKIIRNNAWIQFGRDGEKGDQSESYRGIKWKTTRQSELPSVEEEDVN